VLEFRILGPLEVADVQGPLPLGGPKQRATLAILLLGANRVVPVERLADDLYRGAAPVTAVTQVQRQVSELRRLFGDASVIETRSPGYVLRVAPEQLDLYQFERLADQAEEESARGEELRAAELLREALALWRGEALADLADEPFARAAIERLEEIRLAALERRIDAELDLGRHAELVGELREHVAANPFGERFRGQLMLALYRSGRQAEALDVYRSTRAALIDTFGIEPTPALRDLERAILRHDSTLELAAPGGRMDGTEPRRSVLLLPSDESVVDPLLSLAAPLVGSSRGVVVARLIADGDELARESAMLNARRANLDADVRTAAFTTEDWAGDAVRLAATSDAAFVLVDAPPGLDAALPAQLAELLERSPADVGVLAGSVLDWERGDGVFVPFGGGVHDWAALELATWLASEAAMPLLLVGTKADPTRGRRDASRLLADAALAVQRVAAVPSEPLLAEPSDDALVAALEPATLIVQGVSPRWRQDGIGSARRAVLRGARVPTLLVHTGLRPGGLAPRASRTRFTWSIQSQSG
jgi:DNA-binding SARP family transcriptional activator/nucleotide-binding universal stress UspA family protein